MGQYRPKKTGDSNLDEAFRKAFDYIYALVPLVGQGTSSSAAKATSSAPAAASFSGGGGGGGGGSPVAGQYIVVTPALGVATIDLSYGDWSTFEITGSATPTVISNPIHTSTNQHFVIKLVQDSTGGRSFSFGSAYHGAQDQAWTDNNPGVEWTAGFVVRPDGNSDMLWIPYSGQPY